MLTDSSSSDRVDVRRLAVWDEARCLTLAVHELAMDIQDSSEGAALAAEIQAMCVRLLTKIIEAYDGNNVRKAAQLLSETYELLKKLDVLLGRTPASGRNVSLLRQEVVRVRSLLEAQFSG
jgi:hypothetical protein